MATHSSVLAWRIPGMAEPGRGYTESDTTEATATAAAAAAAIVLLEKEMATHSSVLAWRIPGTGEPCGLPSVGLHRARHD